MFVRTQYTHYLAALSSRIYTRCGFSYAFVHTCKQFVIALTYSCSGDPERTLGRL